MNKTYKTYGIILLVVVILMTIVQLNKKEVIDWSKNFSTTEKSPFGLFVFNEEGRDLLNQKLIKINQSPYSFYNQNHPKKEHNILLIEKNLDKVSWETILQEVKKGSDVMILSEDFPDELEKKLNFKLSDYNYDETSYLYFTDDKIAEDSIVVDKVQAWGIFTNFDFKNSEILGTEYYEKEYDNDYESAANFLKVNYGKGHVYLHAEPLILTNYYLLKKENQKYIQDVFSYLPNRETYWFQESETESSQSPLRFIWANPPLRNAWLIFLFSVFIFILFNAKRRQRIVPIIEPLKNKSVEFIRSIGNLYMQEGDFHDMMAKKSHYFLSRVRTELLIDTHNLDEEFEKKLHLKTGKSPEKIKEAVVLIKKSLNPSAHVINEDLIKLNKVLNEILK